MSPRTLRLDGLWCWGAATCLGERGREAGVAASRLTAGAQPARWALLVPSLLTSAPVSIPRGASASPGTGPPASRLSLPLPEVQEQAGQGWGQTG